MAGDAAPAKELAVDANGAGNSVIPPEIMNRLGWWYYRAEKYSEAETLLRQLAMARPGDDSLRNDLAWVELENNELAPATMAFRESESAAMRCEQWNWANMGLAICLWRARKTEDALKEFDSIASREPRWTNSNLVRAFYSRGVAQSVEEMKAEKAKRVQARVR